MLSIIGGISRMKAMSENVDDVRYHGVREKGRKILDEVLAESALSLSRSNRFGTGYVNSHDHLPFLHEPLLHPCTYLIIQMASQGSTEEPWTKEKAAKFEKYVSHRQLSDRLHGEDPPNMLSATSQQAVRISNKLMQ
jgi:hypothetical protein